jgi:hypothetical protein
VQPDPLISPSPNHLLISSIFRTNFNLEIRLRGGGSEDNESVSDSDDTNSTSTDVVISNLHKSFPPTDRGDSFPPTDRGDSNEDDQTGCIINGNDKDAGGGVIEANESVSDSDDTNSTSTDVVISNLHKSFPPTDLGDSNEDDQTDK